MAPELYGTLEVTELQDLARKVQEYQIAKKLSDSALAKLIPSIGSTKTYKRILNGDLDELDLENQLHGYRSAVAFIESTGDSDEEEEELYDDLYPVIQLRRSFFETTRERGNARVIFLLGANGAGKSSARKLLIEKYGQRLMTVEATVAWNDSPMAMMADILAEFGKTDVPFADRLSKTRDHLNKARRCLIIEEGHHLGPRCLNLVKTLINQTSAEVIVIAIETLWRKLETRAYEEATQLTGNRHADTIRLGNTVRESDVRKMLERRIPNALNGDLKHAAHLVTEKANGGGLKHGLFAFVREVCKRVNEKAGKDEVTLELLTNCVAEEAASR